MTEAGGVRWILHDADYSRPWELCEFGLKLSGVRQDVLVLTIGRRYRLELDHEIPADDFQCGDDS